MSDKEIPGILYVVSTPIGNLKDITLRAIEVLNGVSLIAAEDTRHTQKLLHHYDIHTTQTSYHDHNKEEKSEVLVDRLKNGNDIALVTDAGTPGISDPGYYLINRAIDAGIMVVPVPGPAALIAAISISGLPTDSFVFDGFLPAKGAARRRKLKGLSEERRTLIFYEAPHRLLSTLRDIMDVLGDRSIVLTRELTKIHEEVLRGRVSQVIAKIEAGRLKGEITIIVEGAQEKAEVETVNLQDYLDILMKEEGLSLKDAVSRASKDLDLPRSRVYKEALKMNRPEQGT